jgi:hypothetical protein
MSAKHGVNRVSNTPHQSSFSGQLAAPLADPCRKFFTSTCRPASRTRSPPPSVAALASALALAAAAPALALRGPCVSFHAMAVVDVQHRATPARTQASGFWRHLQCVVCLQVFVCHFLRRHRAFCTVFVALQVLQLRVPCMAVLIVFEHRKVAPMYVCQPL